MRNVVEHPTEREQLCQCPVDLDWVDEWVGRVREFVFVRTEDNVLIKRPNRAWKMNDSAIRILDRLFNAGESVHTVITEQKQSARAAKDLSHFFRDLRRMLKDGLPEGYRSPAVTEKEFHHRFSDYPVLSEIAITYRCNLRCCFCYAGCNCTKAPTGDGREMSLAEVKSVIDMLIRDARVPSVSFTGGEPTLRDDLPDMIRHARETGLRVNLITNGTRCDKALVQRLVDAGLNSVQVSIEGTTAEMHDRVTAIDGSFEKAERALELFLESGITVHTNTTLNSLNVVDARGMPCFARGHGLERLSMNMMIPAGTGSLTADLVIPYSEIGAHIDAIREEAVREDVEFMWYSPTPLCIYNPIAKGLGNKGCAACDGLLSIGANGDVLPCSSYDEPVGNMLTGGFRKVWSGKAAASFRNKEFAHPACRACEHFSACQGGCPLYWRVKGYGELPCAASAGSDQERQEVSVA